MIDNYDFVERYKYIKDNIYNILGPYLNIKKYDIKILFDYIDITDRKLIIALLSILFDEGKLDELRGYKYIEELKSNKEYMNKVDENMYIFNDMNTSEEQLLIYLFRYLHVFTCYNIVLEVNGRNIINFYNEIAKMIGNIDNVNYLLNNSELRYLFNRDKHIFLNNIAFNFNLRYIFELDKEIKKWDMNSVKKLVK